MLLRRLAAMAACLLIPVVAAPPASAQPDADPAPVDAAAAPVDTAAAPVDDGRVASPPPATNKTPDGWVLSVSAKDEIQMPVAPLTTALSSREYVVSGMFSGQISGPGSEARGILEVGYQIGCGIDMSTSNGVTLVTTAGITPELRIGATGPSAAVLTPVTGAISVALKPGIVNIVPVDKKEFKGTGPWVQISNFHVKIDGCVGQSFLRSYATLTRSTEVSDSVLSWVGTTKAV